MKEAIAILRKGGVVVFPTETSYGLAADARNASAVEKVYAIKGRSPDKTVPLIVSTTVMAKKWATFPVEALKLAHAHWPGPFTMVLPKQPKAKLASQAVAADPAISGTPPEGGGGTIALRVSVHSIARSLSRSLDAPIVSTSANRSSEPACYSARAVQKAFKDAKIQPDAMIDAGSLPKRKPSTIIAFSEGKPVVLRK